MKIALPYNTQLGEYQTNVVKGGIEKFCHQIVNTFDVEIINIDNNDPIKENVRKTKEFAKDINADIIITNWIHASFIGAKIVDSEIPIMFVNHGCSGLLSTLNSMIRLNNNYHSVYMVGKWQHDFYKRMAKRVNAENKFLIEGYINSGCVEGEKPKLLPMEYDVCTIGRCVPLDKRPFLLKEWLKDWDYNSLVMTNTPEEELNIKYMNKNLHWDGVLWDLKHTDVMSNLSKSKYYFSTMNVETFGITALEALSHGVPIILRSNDGTHASTDLCADESYYNTTANNIELKNVLDSPYNFDRKEIQDATWEKHSYKNWKKSFSNAIDKTVEKFKNRNLSAFIT